MISRKLVSVRDKEVSNDGAFDFLGHLGHFVRPKQDHRSFQWIWIKHKDSLEEAFNFFVI